MTNKPKMNQSIAHRTKHRNSAMVIFAALVVGFATTDAAENATSIPPTEISQMNSSTVTIHVGTKTFTARLEDNATARAFQSSFPLKVRMTELNGNEKYFRLSEDLPTNASNPGTILGGDLMIYGQNTLVLFYKSFPTSYSYTRLGRIDDPAGLPAALGSGDVTVTFKGTNGTRAMDLRESNQLTGEPP